MNERETPIAGGGRRDPQRFIFASVITITVYLAVIPLIFLVWSSFKAGPISFSGPLTLRNYLEVYGDPATYILVKNTITFAVGAAAIALSLGVLFAWLLERTNVPFRDGAYFLIPLPVAIPGVLFSIGWILLLSPSIGILNKSLMRLFNLEAAPINIYSLGGMIFLEALRLTPITFLMIAGAFRRMDPILEEASSVAGAGTLRTVGQITLGVLRPAILAAFVYIFIAALESFEIPGVIGMRAGIHVLSLKIFLAKQESPPDYGTVSTLAVALLGASAALVFCYARIPGR